jgi:hypothetical protein
MGYKMRCHWEHIGEHIGSLIGTSWELNENGLELCNKKRKNKEKLSRLELTLVCVPLNQPRARSCRLGFRLGF